MGQHTLCAGDLELTLSSKLSNEARLLAEAANRHGPLEGVMRLRALSEIAEASSTHELCELAWKIAHSGVLGDQPASSTAVGGPKRDLEIKAFVA